VSKRKEGRGNQKRGEVRLFIRGGGHREEESPCITGTKRMKIWGGKKVPEGKDWFPKKIRKGATRKRRFSEKGTVQEEKRGSLKKK